MVVANSIPSERRLTCESRDIECREISERRFRDVAVEVSYIFASEANLPQHAPDTPAIPLSRQDPRVEPTRNGDSSRSFSEAAISTSDTQNFLSRCDEDGSNFFTALFEAQKAISSQTRITWKHESGFSLQFFFHRIGFAPLVWGFPAKTRDGKTIRQRLDFPFDFSLKAGVSETFIKEFGASLSSVAPLSGGEKRPSMSISVLNSDDSARIIETLFSLPKHHRSKSPVPQAGELAEIQDRLFL